MAHRQFDSFEWETAWFRKLEPKYKLFWIYINTRCNHYGMWKVDIETAEFMIGDQLYYDEITKHFGDKIYYVVDTGEWFIPDFLLKNYKNIIDGKKSVHKNSYPILLDLGIVDQDGRVKKAFGKGLVTLKDKDINKDKSIEKNIGISREEDKEIVLEKNNEINKEKEKDKVIFKEKEQLKEKLKPKTEIWDDFNNCYCEDIQDGIIETDMTEEYNLKP